MQVVEQEQGSENSKGDPVWRVIEAILQREVVAQEGESVQVEQVRDQINLIRAKECRLGLMLLNSIDIGANLMENLLKDVVSQWLRCDNHKD